MEHDILCPAISGYDTCACELLWAARADERVTRAQTRAEVLDILTEKVNAMPGAGYGSQMGKNFYVRLDDVLHLIEGER